MSIADRKAQRKSVAETLYRRGFTMEAIATQLGVSHPTIVRDLREFVHDEQTQSRVSPRGRKNEGRPKGAAVAKREAEQKATTAGPKPERRKNPAEVERSAAILVLDQGKSYEQAATEAGIVGSPQVMKTAVAREEGRREAEATIDANALSLTAQQKLEAATRQHKRRLDIEFEQRVREEVQRRLEDTILPSYNESYAEHKAVIKARKGVMDRATYKKILSCLHPDRVQEPSLKKRYEEAFRLFTELEKRLLDEKQSPTNFPPMPSSYDDLMAMKAKVAAERKARRAGSTAAVSRRLH